ncbi:MAG: hypothetical protein GX561_01815 [Lentisphaerae bacterium]|jgi:hypothetical protein|nr:hypothetical protein [Lentisphaerota bacterium]
MGERFFAPTVEWSNQVCLDLIALVDLRCFRNNKTLPIVDNIPNKVKGMTIIRGGVGANSGLFNFGLIGEIYKSNFMPSE